MGGRYLVTDVQVGELMGSVRMGEIRKFYSLMNEIVGEQFVFDSENSIVEDVEAMSSGGREDE